MSPRPDDLCLWQACQWATLLEQADKLKAKLKTMNPQELYKQIKKDGRGLLTRSEWKLIRYTIESWGSQPENLIQFDEWAERWDQFVNQVNHVIEERKGEK